MYNIFVNYYIDKNSDRQNELEFCIEENLKNKLLNNYIVICNSSEYDFFSKKHNIEKVIPVIINERPTYNNYFQLISKMYPFQDDINIVSNLDIIIPEETLLYCPFYLSDKSCLALSRWDIKYGGNYKDNSILFDRADSQDTWIFKGGVEQVAGANFTLGIAGCDNSIAHLLSTVGYNVINPSITLRTYHLHLTNIRNYTNSSGFPTQIIQPPYKMIEPTL